MKSGAISRTRSTFSGRLMSVVRNGMPVLLRQLPHRLEPDLLRGRVLVGEDQRDIRPLAEQVLQAAIADIVVGADDEFVSY